MTPTSAHLTASKAATPTVLRADAWWRNFPVLIVAVAAFAAVPALLHPRDMDSWSPLAAMLLVLVPVFYSWHAVHIAYDEQGLTYRGPLIPRAMVRWADVQAVRIAENAPGIPYLFILETRRGKSLKLLEGALSAEDRRALRLAVVEATGCEIPVRPQAANWRTRRTQRMRTRRRRAPSRTALMVRGIVGYCCALVGATVAVRGAVMAAQAPTRPAGGLEILVGIGLLCIGLLFRFWS